MEKVLKKNIYTDSYDPTYHYDLVINPETGKYRIIFSGFKALINPAPDVMMDNGNFTADFLKNPKFFNNNDPNQPTDLANSILSSVKVPVRKAIDQSKNTPNKIPDNPTLNWDKPNQDPLSAVAFNPLTDPDPFLSQIFGGANAPKIEDYGTDMVKLFESESVLAYPMDILGDKKTENTARQDVLCISQYEYKPPYNEAFQLYKDETSRKKLVQVGVERGSALRNRVGTVILPIPNNVADNNGVDWGNGEAMNSIAMALTSDSETKSLAKTALTKGTIEGVLSAIPYISELSKVVKGSGPLILGAMHPELLANPTAAKALQSLVLQQFGVNVSAESLLTRQYGVVSNSNIELLFSGVILRGFEFSYSLTPRSKEEAIRCRKILRFFKQGMAAKKRNSKSSQSFPTGYGSPSFLLGTPNVFKLQYKTWDQGQKQLVPIEGLNRFKICALTNMNTSYSEGMWSAYEKGQPVRMKMNLAFKELEPVYENDYQKDPYEVYKGKEDMDPVIFKDDHIDIGY